jgi:short-subunit dehydrogenase
MRAGEARILLTGASGGIGQAAAEAFVEAGASVLLVGRSAAALSTQASDLSLRCGAEAARATCHAADLTVPQDITRLCDAASAWGANVLVHCAGLPSFGRFESIDALDMQRVLLTNLLAPMMLTQTLLPHLRCLPKAQVICVGSALGRIGLPGFSVYSASKFGLRGFAEALRRELGGSPVRVQYLGPRSTLTGFNDGDVEAHNRATGTAMDTPERVAGAMLRLLESEAAERFIGFPERFAVCLNGLVPTLLDQAFTRHRDILPRAGRAESVATTDPHPLSITS